MDTSACRGIYKLCAALRHVPADISYRHWTDPRLLVWKRPTTEFGYMSSAGALSRYDNELNECEWRGWGSLSHLNGEPRFNVPSERQSNWDKASCSRTHLGNFFVFQSEVATFQTTAVVHCIHVVKLVSQVGFELTTSVSQVNALITRPPLFMMKYVEI